MLGGSIKLNPKLNPFIWAQIYKKNWFLLEPTDPDCPPSNPEWN